MIVESTDGLPVTCWTNASISNQDHSPAALFGRAGTQKMPRLRPDRRCQFSQRDRGDAGFTAKHPIERCPGDTGLVREHRNAQARAGALAADVCRDDLTKRQHFHPAGARSTRALTILLKEKMSLLRDVRRPYSPQDFPSPGRVTPPTCCSSTNSSYC